MGSSWVLSGLQVVLGKPRKTEGSSSLTQPSRIARKHTVQKGEYKCRNSKSKTEGQELPSCKKQRKCSVFLPLICSQQERFSASKDCLAGHLGDISFSKNHSLSKFTVCFLRLAFIHSLILGMISALEECAHRREGWVEM